MALTSTALVMEHMANARVKRSKHLADIYIATPNDFLTPLTLFKAGQVVIKKGWHWYWRSSAGYDIPIREISRNKYEIVTHDVEH